MRWHPPSSSWMAGCELSDPHQAEFHRCCQHPEDGRLEITRRASQLIFRSRDNVLDASFDDQVRRSGQLENSSTVCWISMTFALEEHLQVGNYTPDGRDLFLFFRGVVARQRTTPRLRGILSQSSLMIFCEPICRTSRVAVDSGARDSRGLRRRPT
ncbi:hypothetical protein GQ600_16493 [Phytophthora cactorum]|nr:hypothetical protein GQ600_16493 [Phytophthora cactorum]